MKWSFVIRGPGDRSQPPRNERHSDVSRGCEAPMPGTGVPKRRNAAHPDAASPPGGEDVPGDGLYARDGFGVGALPAEPFHQ